MKFDPEGHLKITPEQLFRLANGDPRRLIDHYLTQGTPAVFPDYDAYYDFLREVSNRFEVHPRNLVLRGSSKLGFSITPKAGKVWMEVGEQSDMDLAIVDAAYYERIDQEVIRWEERNRAHRIKGRASRGFIDRQEDRFFNCCRIKDLPKHLFPHHFDAMRDIELMEHCGQRRELNAFIFRDWWALRARFDFDLRELCKGVPTTLVDPPERPFVRANVAAPPARPSPLRAPTSPLAPSAEDDESSPPEPRPRPGHRED
jgi:hypothetical protein